MPTQRLHVQVHKLIADLVAANQAGLLPEGLAVLSYIANVAQNLNRKPQGYRYAPQVKAIMSAVFLMGGPRSSNVITHNLNGPSESTVRRTIRARTSRLSQSSIALAKLKDGSSPNAFFICSWFKPCNADYRASLQYTFEAGPHELTAVAGECALVEVPRSHARPRCSPT